MANLLLGQLFLISGVIKAFSLPPFQLLIESRGLPGILAYPVVVFEVLAGVLLIFSVYPRVVSLSLIVFVLMTSFLLHFENSFEQVTHFQKNLAIIGGLVYVYLSRRTRPD